MTEQYLQWNSSHLGGNIEMLIFGDRGIPVILFPTSMGRHFENKDFGLIESARWFIDNGLIRIYCPDSVDKLSWYNKGVHPADRVKNHMHYDQFLSEELIPWIRHENGVEKVVTAGCSFGGYHAFNLGFKHPDKVWAVIAMGAAFDIKSQLDGFYSDDVYFNNPPDFMSNANGEDFQHMSVLLGTGTEDMCMEPTVAMANLLSAKKVDNFLDVREGGRHDWPDWKHMFPHYLSLIVNR